VPLYDVAAVIMGQSPPSAAYNINRDGLPFFQGKAEFGALHPTPVKWCTAPKKVAEPDDVLMSVRAPVGPTNIATDRCCIGRGLAAIRPNAGVRSKWLLYAFRSMEKAIDDLGTGTTFKAISGHALRQIEVPIADLEHQDQVLAEIEKQFSRIDEAVASLKRAKGRLARFQDSVLRKAVADWPTTELRGLLREPLRNGHSAKATDDPNGLRAFTLSAVTKGDFSEVNTKRTVADPRKVADLWAQPGDIYVERSNTPELVGTARLYKGSFNFAFIPDLLIRVRVNNRILPEYAEIALRCDVARRYFRGRAQGIAGSMPKIDQETVESFQVPLPPLVEQHRIVADVERQMSVVREVEAEVDANLTRARALRQAVLASVFANPPADQ
jgi:type I restriction enzyme S subunit